MVAREECNALAAREATCGLVGCAVQRLDQTAEDILPGDGESLAAVAVLAAWGKVTHELLGTYPGRLCGQGRRNAASAGGKNDAEPELKTQSAEGEKGERGI